MIYDNNGTHCDTFCRHGVHDWDVFVWNVSEYRECLQCRRYEKMISGEWVWID